MKCTPLGSSVIDKFKGEHEFLSNFHWHWVLLDSLYYCTNEHAYQAGKTVIESERTSIRNALTPGKAKRLGRKVTLRPDFQQVKIQIMADLIEQKFRDPELRRKLIATREHELVEGNTWHDNYWGNCTCTKCAKKPGLNILGKLLMDRRDKILSVEEDNI